jgi:hypothetical protein
MTASKMFPKKCINCVSLPPDLGFLSVACSSLTTQCVACSRHTIKMTRIGVMAHTYNPSCLGSEDQEDHNLRPAQAKS